MAKVFRISFILLIIMLSLYSLCFGTHLEKGILLINSPNEAIYSLCVLTHKKESTFSLLEKADCENAFYGARLINTNKDKETPIDLELGNTIKSPPIPDIQENDLIHFESGQLWNDKSRYHFQEIHLTKTIFDPSLKIVPRLSRGQYKEGDPLYRELERFKGTDIVKPFKILLGLKLEF